MIDTKSNLRHQVLADILLKIGLPAETFATKGNLIDITLCDSRNSIAHGREYFPAPDDFPQLMDEVIGMMEQIHDLIAAAARLSQYRRGELSRSTAVGPGKIIVEVNGKPADKQLLLTAMCFEVPRRDKAR